MLAGVAALLASGGRSEAVRLARGDGADQREALIDQRAMAFSGGVLNTALTGALLVELIRATTRGAYVWILAVGGAAYAGALLRLRRRS